MKNFMFFFCQARRGDKDFIAHSLDLFIDFVQIFRKVLILLMQKVRDSLGYLPTYRTVPMRICTCLSCVIKIIPYLAYCIGTYGTLGPHNFDLN